MRTSTRDLVRGAVAGTGATAVMTLVMFGAQRLGFLGELPPRTISRAGLRALHVHATRRELDLVATVNHLGFGGACGALFASCASRRGPRAPLVLAGVAFGTAVWALSYAGWVPALGILPPPSRDRPDRPWVMVLAHWTFGATLGALVQARRRSSHEGPSVGPYGSGRQAQSGLEGLYPGRLDQVTVEAR